MSKEASDSDVLTARRTFRATLALANGSSGSSNVKNAPGSTGRFASSGSSARGGGGKQDGGEYSSRLSSRSDMSDLGDYTGRIVVAGTTGRSSVRDNGTGRGDGSSYSARPEDLSTARASDLLAVLKAERQQLMRRLKSVDEEIGTSGAVVGTGRRDDDDSYGSRRTLANNNSKDEGSSSTGVNNVVKKFTMSRKPTFLKAAKSIKPWGPKILPKNNKGGGGGGGH